MEIEKKKPPDIENSPNQTKQTSYHSRLSGFDRPLENRLPTLSMVNIRLVLNSETRLLPTVARTVRWVSKCHSSPRQAGVEHLCRALLACTSGSGCCTLAPLGVSKPDVNPTPHIPAGWRSAGEQPDQQPSPAARRYDVPRSVFVC